MPAEDVPSFSAGYDTVTVFTEPHRMMLDCRVAGDGPYELGYLVDLERQPGTGVECFVVTELEGIDEHPGDVTDPDEVDEL
jgi:hypothetical protein